MKAAVEDVKKTGILKIDGMCLTGVPYSIHAKLSGAKVTVFSAHRNHFSTIDESFVKDEFGEIESLFLSHNTISVINEGAVSFFAKSLRCLDLSHNMLGTDESSDESTKECMSESVNLLSRLTSLTTLNLSHNCISQLPAEMANLVNLRELYVNHNVIVKLPPSLFTLTNLQVLNASNNAITSLPAEVGKLHSLERLDLSNNNLRRLPPEIRECEKIKDLCLRGNPWLCPQARVCERGRDAVFRELEQLEAAKGDAGKSTLVDVRNVVVNENWKCTVLVSDANGVPRVCGRDKVTAKMEGPVPVEVSVTDMSDGTYTLEAKFETPGRYELRVTVEDGLVPICPVAVNAWPAADPSDEVQMVDAVPVPDEAVPMSGYGVSEAGVQSYVKLRAMCRQHNVPLEVPEFVVCGSDGYEQLVEAVWGIRISSDLFRGKLFRPVQINFVNEDLSVPRVVVKRDVLLGKSTTGGTRDVNVQLEAVGEYVRDRSTVVSPVPIVIQIDSASVVNSTIIIAPTLPSKDHPARAQLEYIVSELLKVSRREVICVLPCMDWKLVQTLPWIPRILQADPSLRRSLFVFSGLSHLLTTLFCPADLAEWLHGKPANIRGYFVSLLSDALYTESKNDDAVYKKRLWQLCARDTQTMEALQCDTRHERFIGINALRARVLSLLVAAYQKQVPVLQQRLTAHVKSLSQDQERINKEEETLKNDELRLSFLRIAASMRCTEFCDTVNEILHGTTEGKPLEYGRTLDEELLDLAERRPELISGDTESLLAEAADINNRSCRLYGGAQLVRALEMFRASTAAAMKGKPVSSLYQSNTPAEACENAQRQAYEVLVPLISRLCDSATEAVKLIGDVADSILSSRKFDGKKLIGSRNALLRDSECCEGLCYSLIPSLMEYSFLPKCVKDIFMEYAMERISRFEQGCIEDILTPLSGFSLPALEIRDGSNLADAVFCKLVTNCCESVSMHFFSTILQELTVSVPTEIHATIMNMEDAHMTGMFKLEALEKALTTEKNSLAAQLESAQLKQQEARKLVL